jgi:hypothetical protein
MQLVPFACVVIQREVTHPESAEQILTLAGAKVNKASHVIQ